MRVHRDQANRLALATSAPGLLSHHKEAPQPASSSYAAGLEAGHRGPSPIQLDDPHSQAGFDSIDPGLDLFERDSAASLDDLESLYDPSPPLEDDGLGSANSSLEMDNLLANGPEGANTGGGTWSSQPVHDPGTATEKLLPWYPLKKKEVCLSLVIPNEHSHW